MKTIRGTERYKGERIQNAYSEEWKGETPQGPWESFDVCSGCLLTLSTPIEDEQDFEDRLLSKKVDGIVFYYGNPAGDYWSKDVEHPPYDDEDYRCHICEIDLGDE